jgi:hypothetical protein
VLDINHDYEGQRQPRRLSPYLVGVGIHYGSKRQPRRARRTQTRLEDAVPNWMLVAGLGCGTGIVIVLALLLSWEFGLAALALLGVLGYLVS